VNVRNYVLLRKVMLLTADFCVWYFIRYDGTI